MTSPGALYHLALRELHTVANATLAVANGWSVPLHYGAEAEEYAALRAAAVVMDRSSRSRFMVTGTDAEEVLSASFAGHLDELEEGRAMRSVSLDERGEIRDLVLVARTGGIAYLVTGEPGQRGETLERLRSHVKPDFDVRIDDRTESTCTIAVVGPAAEQVVREHLSDGLPERLQQLHSVTFEFHGFRTQATRTSDCGEDGFELMLAPAVAQHVIETLVAAGVRLAGRAAAECARVESCIPAFSPDLESGLSPAEADIDLLLGIPGGRERWMLSAVLVEGGVVAAGTPVVIAGARAGEVRSCLYSHALRAAVALAAIESRLALPGTSLDLNGIPATIVAKPFYRRRT